MTPAVIKTLMEEEGFRPSAYPDHLGFTTIGHGICIDARKGCGITVEESEYLLKNRVGLAVRGLAAALPWYFSLDDARRKALALMAYQLGVKGVLNFKKMLDAMKYGDFGRAADEALDSTWAKQTPKRAYRVSQLIRNGE
jgi:lysozyme